MRYELPIRAYVVLICVLIIANIFLYTSLFAPTRLKISILDVGKEEKVILIKSPENDTILINTGPDASILRALGTALPPWQRKIDVLLLTNASAAAATGLPTVLNRYQSTVLIRPNKQGTKSIEAIINESTLKNNLQLVIMNPGKSLKVGHEMSISPLSPEEIVITYRHAVFHITKNTPSGVIFSDGNALEGASL